MDDSPSPEARTIANDDAAYRRKLLTGALKNLNERERHIFVERRLKDDPVTLEELGKQYGVSRERIRQLEARAFDKVQNAVRAAASPE